MPSGDRQRAAARGRYPAPRATNGTPAWWQARDDAPGPPPPLPGRTTRAGVCAYWSSPSDSYVRSWCGCVWTCSGPQMRSNALTRSPAALSPPAPVSSDHHPGEDVRRLQVDDRAHDKDQDQAPPGHLPEDISLLAREPDRRGADRQVLRRDPPAGRLVPLVIPPCQPSKRGRTSPPSGAGATSWRKRGARCKAAPRSARRACRGRAPAPRGEPGRCHPPDVHMGARRATRRNEVSSVESRCMARGCDRDRAAAPCPAVGNAPPAIRRAVERAAQPTSSSSSAFCACRRFSAWSQTAERSP